MKTISPLRYPGGKSAMANIVGEVRRINRLGNRTLAEPFAGGAGASLSLLFNEQASEIHINDFDKSIRDFWWAVTTKNDEFVELLRSTRISMAEWRRQRDIYRMTSGISRLRRGFAAFYLNRCNRSGVIVNGGPIGGIKQAGPWKLNARYNKIDLIERCLRIAEFRDRINVSGLDGIRFIDSLDHDRTFYFIDPPYFEKGQSLYLNATNALYHGRLAGRLREMEQCSWLLTYDDCTEIRELYSSWANVRPFTLRYTAARRRSGKEILITPKWMKLPSSQNSLSINW